MYCPTCGEPRDAEDKYCRHCGAQLNDEAPMVVASKASLARRQDRRADIVRGVAALALATGAELFRRQVGRWLNPERLADWAGKLLRRRRSSEAAVRIPVRVNTTQPADRQVVEASREPRQGFVVMRAVRIWRIWRW